MNQFAFVGVVVALLPAAVSAQRAAETPQPRPVPSATGSMEPARYESAFEGYRAWRDEPMESWREVNDRVGRVGGHAGVLKSDVEPASRPAGTSQPAGTHPGVAPSGGGHRHGH